MAPSPPSSEDKLHNRHTVQVGGKAKERVDKLAAATGLPRSQVVEYLVMRGGLRDTTRELKEAGIIPPARGRRKSSIFE